jgi:hypothetical protein
VRRNHDKQVFYSAGRVPGVGIALFGVLALFLSSALSLSIGGAGGVVVLCVLTPLITLGLIALDRGARYPRLVLDDAALAYRDAHGTVTMAASDIAEVEGGERVAVVDRSGNTVEFPAIAAPQYQVARGHDTYPDRVAESIRTWVAAHGADQVELTVHDPLPDRVRGARTAMIAAAAVWACVILIELVKDVHA